LSQLRNMLYTPPVVTEPSRPLRMPVGVRSCTSKSWTYPSLSP
jgi:hypothetical protein